LQIRKKDVLCFGKEVVDMAVETITPDQVHKHARQWEHTALTTELLLASGVVVLSILGIAGVFPTYLAAIAVIGLGAILLFQGATVVLHYGELLYEAGTANKVGAAEVSRGLTTEFLTGTTGIVLGVLALLGIVPTTLLSVAVITYGGTLLLTSGEALWLNSLGTKQDSLVMQLMQSMGLAAAGAQVLVGLGSLVLGILGLVGIASMMMVLVALLAISVSILLRSSSVGGLLLDFLHI
jgi:hypothetical protein